MRIYFAGQGIGMKIDKGFWRVKNRTPRLVSFAHESHARRMLRTRKAKEKEDEQ